MVEKEKIKGRSMRPMEAFAAAGNGGWEPNPESHHQRACSLLEDRHDFGLLGWHVKVTQEQLRAPEPSFGLIQRLELIVLLCRRGDRGATSPWHGS